MIAKFFFITLDNYVYGFVDFCFELLLLNNIPKTKNRKLKSPYNLCDTPFFCDNKNLALDIRVVNWINQYFALQCQFQSFS